MALQLVVCRCLASWRVLPAYLPRFRVVEIAMKSMSYEVVSPITAAVVLRVDAPK
jgi:hypothetical protein